MEFLTCKISDHYSNSNHISQLDNFNNIDDFYDYAEVKEMGKVKKETVNNGRNNHEWDAVNLSSINNLYILIKNRAIFESTYLSKQFVDTNPLVSQGVPRFVENIVCVYADIDSYIKKTNLTEMQLFILKYIQLGYNYQDISLFIQRKFNNHYSPRFVKNFFLCICKRIYIQINYDYEIWTELAEYKKITPTSKFEVCCSCKESHNMKDLYLINRLKDKKYYYCRNCKSFTDWKRYMRKKHKINKV